MQPHFASILHLLGSGEAQNTDAGLQHILCQSDQGDIALLQFFVLFGENAGLVIELVDCAGQFIDIGADLVGRRCFQSRLQSGTQLGNCQHQILGVLVGRSLNGQLLPGTVTAEDGLDTDNGIQDIGSGVATRMTGFNG